MEFLLLSAQIVNCNLKPGFPRVLKSPGKWRKKNHSLKVLNLDIGPEKVLKKCWFWSQRSWKNEFSQHVGFDALMKQFSKSTYNCKCYNLCFLCAHLYLGPRYCNYCYHICCSHEHGTLYHNRSRTRLLFLSSDGNWRLCCSSRPFRLTNNMSRAVYQRRTVTCLATLTESDCTVVLQQKIRQCHLNNIHFYYYYY